MSVSLRIFIAVIDVLGFIYVTHLVRKNWLELKFALSWLAMSVFVLLMDLFPAWMERMTDVLGFELPVNMMFLIGFIFTLAIILILTVALSISANSVKRLNQQIAILEKRIRELEEKA